MSERTTRGDGQMPSQEDVRIFQSGPTGSTNLVDAAAFCVANSSCERSLSALEHWTHLSQAPGVMCIWKECFVLFFCGCFSFVQ